MLKPIYANELEVGDVIYDTPLLQTATKFEIVVIEKETLHLKLLEESVKAYKSYQNLYPFNNKPNSVWYKDDQ